MWGLDACIALKAKIKQHFNLSGLEYEISPNDFNSYFYLCFDL